MGEGGVIFNPKIYIAVFGPLCIGLLRGLFGKKLQYDFLKMKGVGVKGPFLVPFLVPSPSLRTLWRHATSFSGIF